MFRLLKKVVLLIFFGNELGNIIKNISGNFEIFMINKPNCLFLKNQECKVRKVIVENDYMTFPYKIGTNRCIGSCNNENNSYFKIFSLFFDSIKNITVKSLDLLTREFVFKNISFHKTCKCGCFLDEKACNNLQKFNKNKCRCECLIVKKCKNGYSWNVNNCKCESKKLARLISIEECDIETYKIKDIECKILPKNKTLPENKTLIKKVENCKPFIGRSILFLLDSLIFGGVIIHFYFKFKNNSLPY